MNVLLQIGGSTESIRTVITNPSLVEALSSDPSSLKKLVELGYHVSTSLVPTLSSCGCCDKIDEFSTYLEPFQTGGNSSKNGKLAEVFSSELFQKRNPEIVYTDTAHIEKSGDAVLTIQHHLLKTIMIDWKNYESCIPSDETTKLLRDLDAQNMKYGILFSYRSRICKRKYIDYEMIGDKLIVFISDTGMNIHMVEMAIQFLVKLFEAHSLQQSTLVSELVVKRVQTHITEIFDTIMTINRKHAQHINKIKENQEKSSKMYNDMISNGECIRHDINLLLGSINTTIQDIHREPLNTIHSYNDLSDTIDRKVTKEKDKGFGKRILAIANDMDIRGCYSEADNHIHFHDIGKLNITKSKLTMIFYNKDEEQTSYNRKYETVKNDNFHISLTDDPNLWRIVQTRFKVPN